MRNRQGDNATIDDDCVPCTIDLTLDSVEVKFDGGGTATNLTVDIFSAGNVTNGTKLTLIREAILTNISP